MKKNFLFYLALAATPLFTACSNEELANNEEPTEGTPVTFTIGDGGAVTRTVTTEETDRYKTVFTAGEAVGIYATGAATATNAQFNVSSDGNKLESSTPITIANTGTADFKAYSPYSATAGDTYVFNVKSDQTSIDNFNASNLLTATCAGVTASSPTVSFTFQPRLAIVRVEMAGAEGVNTSAVTLNAKPQVTWTAATDALSEAEGDATDIKMWHQNATAASADAVTNQLFAAFVPAQQIEAGTSFLTMAVGQKQYRFKPKSAFTLSAGKINKFRVTIGENGEITIESITIDVKDWEVNDLTNIEGDLEEVEPEPVAPIELITAVQGTPTAEKVLNQSTGIRGTKEGWNKVLTNATKTTIDFDATEAAFKIANDNTGAWHQKALVYRTADGKGSLGKYTLSFSVMTDEGYDIQLRVMRGQQSSLTATDDPDTFFCIGTGTYGPTYISTVIKDANQNVTKGQWLNKSFTIDLSKLGTSSSAVNDATMDDFAHGIAVVIACKTATEAQNIYIKDLTFKELQETAAE